MKRLFLLCLASFALVMTARGDLTIVQKIDGGGGLNQMTLKIKGDKARVEVSPQITTILDTKSGELTTLLNDRKTVMRISGEKANALAEMAKSLVTDQSGVQPAPKPTGRKETINGYETEEYVTEGEKFHARYWVAKSYPDYAAILRQMEVMKNGAFAAISKSMPDFHALPGLPLRSHVKLQNQGEVTSTIASVSQSPIPDSEFAIPAGYTEMKMPDFLGGKQPPAKPDKPGQE